LIELLSLAGKHGRTPIIPVLRTQPIPLSYAQQRLWFLDQLEPGNAFYNIPVAVRLSGELNDAALEQSLNEIVRRHENLRTTFITTNGQAEQTIAARLFYSGGAHGFNRFTRILASNGISGFMPSGSFTPV
jgi:Condensation domain.